MIKMTEHKICKGCKWNHYPECHGTIMGSGDYMIIEDRAENFECGKKDELEVTDFSIKIKSELELRVEELEGRLSELEK